MDFATLLQQYKFPLFLAPMEEVTDHSFRCLCKEFGADFLISEFVSSEALIRDVEKSIKKLTFSEKERPFGIQIFGYDENSLAGAAQIAAEQQPDFIDINWGCPVKKVVNKGAGAAILKDIPKMVRLTEAVVKSVNCPVTVKTRLGWEESDKPIVSVVERLQDIGIQGVSIHGRTRSQFYSGEADWTLIGEIKDNPRVQIPIIGNGDIDSAEKAFDFKKRYGVDGIMIGRATIGNPWIFAEIRAKLEGKTYTSPTLQEKINVCLQHLKNSVDWKGERTAVLEMRRHYAAYFKGIPHFKEKKIKLMAAQTLSECEELLQSIIELQLE